VTAAGASISPIPDDAKIAIIGAGVMGETFIGGLMRSGTPAGQIVICEQDSTRAVAMRDRFGVSAMPLADAASTADVVLISVKPPDARAVLQVVGPLLRPGSLLISIVAGVSIQTMESHVADGVSCIRAMPNTPAVIGEGMTVISVGAATSAQAVGVARRLLSVIGQVAQVEEHLQDAVTAISGSGPAYVFAFMEALEAAGIELGLDPDLARALVLQTVAGAAQLARVSDAEPAELRRRVTSPGGTTQAALRVLIGENSAGGDLADLLEHATRAARDRSIELGRED
jgi:pyrroline-5-carboxylate reductase